MGELDRVLDALMKAKTDIIRESVSKEEQEELIEALRERKKSLIIQEIKEEYKAEVLKEVDLEIQQQVNAKKISELKSLMWNGFALAFVVGLAVNQVTDVIGYYKGSVNLEVIWPTNIIVAVLLLICLAFYFYGFIKSALSIINKEEK